MAPESSLVQLLCGHARPSIKAGKINFIISEA